jgi:hypothetical protein
MQDQVDRVVLPDRIDIANTDSIEGKISSEEEPEEEKNVC